MLQILQSVIDNLDLFLDDRHSPGEVVVLPDFGGQTVELGLKDRLLRLQFMLNFPV